MKKGANRLQQDRSKNVFTGKSFLTITGVIITE